MDVLDLRQLNRATLARQGLLEHSSDPIAVVVDRVGGIQAQQSGPMATGLWSRIEDFAREDLCAAALDGSIVRGTSLRITLHMHAVDDYRALRMTLQPMLDRWVRSQWVRGRVREQDVEPAIELGRELLSEEAMTIGAVKAGLAARFPQSDPQGLGNVVRTCMQLLMVPDAEAPNGWPNVAAFTEARRLVGDTLAEEHDVERVVRRFFECLGPGTARDVQTWCGLTRLKPVVQAMVDRGELVELTTWEGDDLLDLPDAPRPSGDTPAPPRFLPMWDNLLLSHADRSRVIHPSHKPFLASKNGMPPPTFLIDGFVHGTWRAELEGDEAVLRLTPFLRIPGASEAPLVAEGEALLAFLHPGAARRTVRVA